MLHIYLIHTVRAPKHCVLLVICNHLQLGTLLTTLGALVKPREGPAARREKSAAEVGATDDLLYVRGDLAMLRIFQEYFLYLVNCFCLDEVLPSDQGVLQAVQEATEAALQSVEAWPGLLLEEGVSILVLV